MFKLNSERPFGGSKALVVDYWLSKEEQKKEEKKAQEDDFTKMLSQLVRLTTRTQ